MKSYFIVEILNYIVEHIHIYVPSFDILQALGKTLSKIKTFSLRHTDDICTGCTHSAHCTVILKSTGRPKSSRSV